MIDDEVLTERTLFHLAACAECGDAVEQEARDREGPANSSWSDLLCAVMEGLERDWVHEAHLTRVDGCTHLRWSPTDRGERAFRAHRRRLRNAPVIDETGEDGSDD